MEASEIKADPYQRYIIGQALDWEAPTNVPSEHDVMHDAAVRRYQGWHMIQAAFRPATVSNPGDKEQGYMPTWLTWYTNVEIESMFRDLYLALPPQERGDVSNGEVSDELIDCVIDNFVSLERLRTFQGSRFQMSRIAQLQSQDTRTLTKLAKQVTYFSPGYVKHMLRNYAKMITCDEKSDSFEDPTNPQEKVGCFFKPFPEDAVSIKAAWMHPEDDIEFFDTTAQGIKTSVTEFKWSTEKVLVNGEEKDRVVGGDPFFDDKIFTVNIPHPNGNYLKFRLVGMHVATKALPEWTWSSIWWSPTKSDFAKGRPDNLGQYQNHDIAELRNYKMCSVANWVEKDDQLARIFETGSVPRGEEKSYEAALLAAQQGAGRDDNGNYLTFCANPFIEKDSEMLDSNCIGCHQTAGPQGSLHFARDQVIKRFPADYAWAFRSAGNAQFVTDDRFQDRFQKVAQRYKSSAQRECVPAGR